METDPLALAAIRPYLPRIYYIVGGGVADWFEALKLYPRMAIARSDRGCANLVYDFMRFRAKEAFADLIGPKEVEIVEAYESVLVRLLKAGPTLKFNKLDDEKRAHRPNTDRSAEFYYQHALYPGAETTDVTVICGYRLAVEGASLADVLVLCQRGDQIDWSCTVPPPPDDDQFSLTRRSVGPRPSQGFGGARAKPGDDKAVGD